MSDTDVQGLREELAQLRAEVQRLSDRQAIVDCLHRYTRGLDRHDREILASAYYENAIDNHGGFTGSPQEFIDWVTELLNEWDTHAHFLDPNVIEIDGDVAHSECYILFTQRRADGGGLDFGAGRYIDRLERRNGEWRIAVRRVMIDWTARAETAVFADVAEYPGGKRDRTDLSYQRPLEAPKASS